MAGTGVSLGYGGGARFANNWVFVTGGNVSRAKTIPLFQPFGMPLEAENRHQVNFGDGIYAFNGSVNFDLTDVSLGMINDFTTRNFEFDTVLHDGNVGYLVQKCKMDSFSIAAAPLSLVTGTLSFNSTNNGQEDFQEFASSPDYIFDSQQIIKYWNTGASNVESFSLTVNQSLTPVYLNTDSMTPAYIRAGGISISLSVTSWADWFDNMSFAIGNKMLTVNTGARESIDFNYGGQTDTGTHVYSLKAYSETDSSARIITIT